MIPRIKSVTASENYHLHVIFDDGRILCFEGNSGVV